MTEAKIEIQCRLELTPQGVGMQLFINCSGAAQLDRALQVSLLEHAKVKILNDALAEAAPKVHTASRIIG